MPRLGPKGDLRLSFNQNWQNVGYIAIVIVIVIVIVIQPFLHAGMAIMLPTKCVTCIIITDH